MKKDGWTLIHEKTGEPIKIGETLTDFRGATATLTGGNPPHKPGSSGFVFTTRTPGGSTRESYPSVFNLKWVKDSA